MPAPPPLHFPPFQLDPVARQLTRDGAVVELGVRALDLLLVLVQARGELVTKSQLLERTWPGLVVEEANIHVQVSALRRVLGADAIATVPGIGYRFAWPLLDAPPEHLGPVRAVRHNLPGERSAFVGRETALAEAAELLTRARLLTLIGIGGAGKTRLARKLAERQLPQFADGVCWVDLASVDGEEPLAAAVAHAAGVALTGSASPLNTLARALRPRQALLVLDNCEHLTDPVASLAEALLSAAPRLVILATSREALALPGEALVPVRPMGLPQADAPLDRIADAESVRLFVQAAMLAHGGFELDAVTAPAVARVCRALDGIPLALELAAAQIRVLGPLQLQTLIEERLQLLTGPRRALPRQQTLEGVIRWSHDRLPAADQQLLAALSVCQDGCELTAAQALAGADDDCAGVVNGLSRLSESGLIEVLQVDGIARYRLLETVRQFAARRLDESGQAARVQDRHALHYLIVAEAGASAADSGSARWRLLRRERDNFVRALWWLSTRPPSGDTGPACRLIAALRDYWHAAGWLPLGLQRSIAALPDRDKGAPSESRAQAYAACTQMAMRASRTDLALQFAQQALAEAEASGLSPRERVIHHVRLAQAWRIADDLDEAEEQVRLAAALLGAGPVHESERKRFAHHAAAIQVQRGAISARRGDWEIATKSFDDARAQGQIADSISEVAANDLNAAAVALLSADLDDARRRLLRSRPALQMLDSAYLDAAWLDLAAACLTMGEQWPIGLQLLGASETWRAAIGQPPGDLVSAVIADRMAALRAAHGGAAIDTASAASTSAPPGDAIAMAMELLALRPC